MSAPTEQARPRLEELAVADVVANERNPRLDFPQPELDRLAESIDQEGILVPIVVYPKNGKYVLVDGERRFRCVRDLGLDTIPAVITEERSEREVLQQMFNIHLIREQWRDIPTARAVQTLADQIRSETGDDPSDRELKELTGLSIDRVRQLRYVVTLPDEWQQYIRDGSIPLNYFWELKKNVLDALANRRPRLLLELGGESVVSNSFVDKRLNNVITDTVSLRKIAPIIRVAAQDAEANGNDETPIDESIRHLITSPEAKIDDAYEETVQMMVEVDKLGRRTASMVTSFRRLLTKADSPEERRQILDISEDLRSKLAQLTVDFPVT